VTDAAALLRQIRAETMAKIAELERWERVADLHSDPAFIGMTWVIERGRVRAMTPEDVAWLDAQWSFVDRWL
jgi:hypothetical protein